MSSSQRSRDAAPRSWGDYGAPAPVVNHDNHDQGDQELGDERRQGRCHCRQPGRQDLLGRDRCDHGLQGADDDDRGAEQIGTASSAPGTGQVQVAVRRPIGGLQRLWFVHAGLGTSGVGIAWIGG